MSNGERDTDDEHEDAARESFINLAGEDGEVDAFELQNILNGVFKRGTVVFNINSDGCELWLQAGRCFLPQPRMRV